MLWQTTGWVLARNRRGLKLATKMKERLPQEGDINFADKKKSVYTFEAGVKILKLRQEHFEAGKIEQQDAEVEIHTRLPFLLVPTGDWHYGNVYCDIDRLQKDLKEIEDRPNTGIVLMGNLLDIPQPQHFDSVVQNPLSPQEQIHTLHQLIKHLDRKHKIIAAIDNPCHEGHVWRKEGIDVLSTLFEGVRFPIIHNGGIVNVKFPGAEYKVALFHQFGPFNSNFNKSHGLQQMQRLFLGGQADIVVGAHHHVGEALKTWYGEGKVRKPVVYIRSGSYKGAYEPERRDLWIQLRAGKTGEPGGESVVLFPREKAMSAELELPLGLKVFDALTLQEKIKIGQAFTDVE